MLVPSDMIGPQSKLMFQVNKFCGERVHARKFAISKTVREVCKVVQGRRIRNNPNDDVTSIFMYRVTSPV